MKKAKYKAGDLVQIVPYKFWPPKVIVSVTETLSSFRYEVAHPKKDGMPHKRRVHFWFNETEIKLV